MRGNRVLTAVLGGLWAIGAIGGLSERGQAAEFRAGAAAVDITPTQLPVLINGGMLSRSAKEIHSRIYARAIVLEDGRNQLAIVVVDSCMMPRALLDEVKQKAAETTGIPASNILISATHAHSVPSSGGALGTDADPHYPDFLKPRLVEAIQRAAQNLQPARVGIAAGSAPEYTALRRWIRRPDKMLVDPFGNRTVRANMHPGYQSPDAIGPSGPEDPELPVLAFQTRDGRPIAVLANFSMHYYGAPAISADYFGLFSERLARRIAGEGAAAQQPVVIMSHGCSGDVWLRDYLQPAPKKRPHDISSYTEALVRIAYQAYQRIQYRDDVTLSAAQAELPLRYRVPDQQRLEWAKRIVEQMGDRPPKDRTEVYAREAIFLHERQSTRLILQAFRIGPIGLAAIPNEVYALTGLKLKTLSPLQPTVVIELANGAEGYIPPPEQHALGGYNTWPARSAGLEVEAEPKIVETVLELLEKVAGRPRRAYEPTCGPAAQAVLDLRPVAYWRLDEFSGPRARDQRGCHDGIYETGVVFYLDGPASDRFNRPGEVNRCAHFAGGRLRTRISGLGDSYSVSLWFWNGMPNDARSVTGFLFSRGRDYALAAPGDHLGIGGTQAHTGRLVFTTGADPKRMVGGKTAITRWSWNHVVLVRDARKVRVYLNGQRTPEIDAEVQWTIPPTVSQLFFGGRNDNDSNFEGRLDEIAVYDRPLSADEVVKLYAAARGR
ncbi:MAG: hypothetical protein GXP27_00770 [Planctomycetes bacterium]|nr:hypothetical protein [Planctomycetota bacterium]